MLKIIGGIIGIFIIASSGLAGNDWSINFYDEAQKLIQEFHEKEYEQLLKLDPKTKDFIEIDASFNAVVSKLNRRAFVLKINDSSVKIDWSDYWEWAFWTVSKEEQEELIRKDSEYKEIYNEYLRLKEIKKQSVNETKIRNQLYKDNSETFYYIEEEFANKLKLLQKKVDKKRQ
ncbi:MAG: hypothetical protein ABIG64_10470 [Candidatus Omnitrophota bacterium]